MSLKKVEFSIIIPVYNEEDHISDLYEEIVKVLFTCALEYEIIFSDDGSTDGTFEAIKEIHKTDPKVRAVRLSRNFGQSYAFLAGNQIARGGIVITMDGDRQNDPGDIPKLLKKMGEGYSLVSGWRKKRKDHFARRICSLFANLLMSRRTGVRLHDYGCALCAMRRDFLSCATEYGDKARFIKPLLMKLSDSTAELEVSHLPRESGRSKYNVFKIALFGLDFLLNFKWPMQKGAGVPYIIEEIVGKT